MATHLARRQSRSIGGGGELVGIFGHSLTRALRCVVGVDLIRAECCPEIARRRFAGGGIAAMIVFDMNDGNHIRHL